MQEGPFIRINTSCSDCVYVKSEYYYVEDGNSVDSGFNYWCSHPVGQNRDVRYRTPEWCPFLKDAIKKAGEKDADDESV